MTTTKFKGLTLCTLAAVFAAGQAFAHTGVRDQATEGTASYNGFTIGHGCGAGGDTDDEYPVLGQAALFPFGANAVWKRADGTVLQEGGNGNGTISSNTLSLAVTGYDSFSSPFTTSQEIVDDAGVVQALLWKDGAMTPKMNAITPFKISPPTIIDNCTTLKIRIGVINYCDVGKNASNDIQGPYKMPKTAFGKKVPIIYSKAKNNGIQTNVSTNAYYKTLNKGNGDNNRADWWFGVPHGGSSKYNDADLITDAWATLTVNNSAEQLATCPKDAKGIPVTTTVTVEPNGVAFDTFLSGPNTLPFSKDDINL
jgi:hypothetical protein